MTDLEAAKCIFIDILKTCSEGNKSFANSSLTDQRIDSIIASSKLRNDGFHTDIDPENKLNRYQPSCYSTYNSKIVIEKYNNAKKKSMEQQSTSLIGSPSNKKPCLRSK